MHGTENRASSTTKGQVSSGHARLDEALGGGFPRASAVVISASPSTEVTSLIRGFLELAPDGGSRLIIAKSLASARTVSPGVAESVKILVCGEVVAPSPNVSSGRSIENLTELNIRISEAIKGEEPTLVATDILSDVLLRHKALLTRKWLSELLGKLRARGITTLAVINPAMHPREETEAVLDLFDGSFEIQEETLNDGRRSTLRIRWMHGASVARNEILLSDLAPQQLEVEQPKENSVAVVDFANIAGAQDLDWLSGGIAETVTVDLKKISSLKVASREKVSQALKRHREAKVSDEQVLTLGRALGVRWIIWGGFQKFGNAVRITAHFTDSSTGELVGSAKLDGSMDEIFKLQDEIITNLMGTLNLAISSVEIKKIETPQTIVLEAYEYFAKGRQLFSQFGRTSFDQAQRLFEKAIELDPRYALAYSGLGSIHIFRFIEQTDPRDLDIGISNLQTSIRYDPDLAEPYQWLTYAFTRRKRLDEAIQAGQRAVELEPDNFLAHYFLGTAHMIKAATRFESENYDAAIRHLMRATVIQPGYQPAHMNLSWIFMLQGNYAQAETHLEKAVSIEQSEKFEGVKFVGAMTLMGNLCLRRGQLEEAQHWYQRSLESLEKHEHFYKQQFIASTYCGFADVAISRRQHDSAMENFKKAREVLAMNPKALGAGYVHVRISFGLAKAFYRLGMRDKAEQELRNGLDLASDRQRYDFSWMWEGSDADIYFHMATCLATMNRNSEAMQSLQRAILCGLSDANRIKSDDAFHGIQDEDESEFHQLLQELRAREQ